MCWRSSDSFPISCENINQTEIAWGAKCILLTFQLNYWRMAFTFPKEKKLVAFVHSRFLLWNFSKFNRGRKGRTKQVILNSKFKKKKHIIIKFMGIFWSDLISIFLIILLKSEINLDSRWKQNIWNFKNFRTMRRFLWRKLNPI